MIQGKYELELFFSDDRIFLNYWDSIHGNDVCVQIKDDKLLKFVYTPKEVEDSEVDGVDIDVLKQKEISLSAFLEAVKDSIKHSNPGSKGQD